MNASDYLVDIVETKHILGYCITFAFAHFIRLLFPKDIANVPFLLIFIIAVLVLLQINPLSNYIIELTQMYDTIPPEESLRTISYFLYSLVFVGAFVGIRRGDDRVLKIFQYFLIVNLIMLLIPLMLLYSGLYQTNAFSSVDVAPIVHLLLGIYLVRSVNIDSTTTESTKSMSNETSQEEADFQKVHPDESSEDTIGRDSSSQQTNDTIGRDSSSQQTNDTIERDVSSQQANHGVSGDTEGTADGNPSTSSESDPIKQRLSNLSTIQKAILIGAFLAIAGTVLPWRTGSALGTSFSVSLFDIGSGGDALVIIVMSLVVILLVSISDSTNLLIVSTVPSGLVFIMCIIYLTGFNTGNSEISVFIQTGLGTYLTSLGSVLMTGGILYEIYIRTS